MNSAAKVSVLVLSYNFEAFLEAAVESVLAQTRPADEIVIADDGSTDRTQRIIRELAARHSSIVPVLSDWNQGLSHNWNSGMSRCGGDYIAVLSGDDLMMPDKVRRQLEFMEAHPECGLSTHEMDVFDSETGRTLYYTDERFRQPAEGVEMLFATNWFFGREMKSIGSSEMARREFFMAALYDEKFKLWNEWLHMIDCMAKTGKKWGHLCERLGRYRMRSDQMHTSSLAKERSFTEGLGVLDTAAVRYPRLARLAKNKKDFFYFQHLLFDWLPVDERVGREREFRKNAGFVKWAYLKFCRGYLKRRGLFESTRMLRKWVQRFVAR